MWFLNRELPVSSQREIDPLPQSLPVNASEGLDAIQSLPDLQGVSFPSPLSGSPFIEFENWLIDYFEATPQDRVALLDQGREIADRRREELKKLIVVSPEFALALAIPYEVRTGLPPTILSSLEEPISDEADFELIVWCPEPGGASGGHARIAQMGERDFDVYTYGDRLESVSKNRISLHGIAIDNLMAASSSPARTLSAAERADLGFSEEIVVSVGAHYYHVSDETTLEALQNDLAEDERMLGPDNRPRYSALRMGEFDGVAALPSDGSAILPLADDPPLALSPHTEGPKTMLYIRARFSDQSESHEPNDLATVTARQTGCEVFWHENSYGKSSLVTTFTSTVTLPNTSSYYAGLSLNRFSTLLNAATAAAVTAGNAVGEDWDAQNYDFYTVLTTGGSWGYAGIASVGGRRSHLNGSNSSHIRTASHEFGHNLGLRHANYWRTDSTSPIGRDSIPGGYVGDEGNDERIEYGHRFSTMAAQGGSGDFNDGRAHYTTGEKTRLDWLLEDDGDWVSIDSSTTVPIRLYRHDIETADLPARATGVVRAIKINRDSGDYASSNKRRYWLSYRRLPTNGDAETWLRRGLQVDWQRENYGGDGSILLDMTPFSDDSPQSGGGSSRDNDDKEDSALIVGRTYSDAIADIHFTPIAQGGTSPNEWIDVIVNFDTQTGNSNPEISAFTATATQVEPNIAVDFSAAASDPDGDPVYYTWTFGDNSMVVGSLNSPTATKSWQSSGFYPVRLTASDGKGGKETREIIIQVGSPSESLSISGRVIHAGIPVEGTRVNIGSDEQAWTDSNGEFTLPGLGSGSYTVAATKGSLSLQPQFANPIVLTEFDAFGNDFIADDDGPGTGSLELAITPYQATVPLGAQSKFTVHAWDATGLPTTLSPTWTTSAGSSIDQSGVFTANAVGGPFTITATDGVASASAFVTVDDIDAIGIEAIDGQGAEPGVDDGAFRIKRYGSVDGDLTVHFTVDGDATEGLDYAALPRSTLIPDGAAFVDMPLDVLDDFEEESTENVTVTIQADESYSIFSLESSATVEIIDNGDIEIAVAITSPSLPEIYLVEGTTLALRAAISDEGIPNAPDGPITATWSVLNSPAHGYVNFWPNDSLNTAATFSARGIYSIQLTVTNGENFGRARLEVNVDETSNTSPSFEDSVVHFQMNEGAGTTLNNLVPSDIDGTLLGDAVWAMPEESISDGGIHFDGIDDRITVPDADEINLENHEQRTVALWFKASDPFKPGKQLLYEEGGTSRGLNIYIEAGTLYVGGWNSDSYNWQDTFLSTGISDTNWHHVALVLDPVDPDNALPGSFMAYLDGEVFASGSGARLNSHSGDTGIGAFNGATLYHDGRSTSSGDYFEGTLDEFRLWNRALSESEVRLLYSWVYEPPRLTMESTASSPGSVVIPSGVGIVLDSAVTGSNLTVSNWAEVAAPSGGSASLETLNDGTGAAATFSAPGFYTLRLFAENEYQGTAWDVNIHAGIETPDNPTTENQAIHFSFDEGSGTTAANAIAGGVNGALANGVAWTIPNGGLSGIATAFDGIDDIITTPEADPIGGAASHTQKTIALWIKPSNPGTSDKEILFEQGNSEQGINLYLLNNTLFAGAWNTETADWETYLSLPISRENWRHIALILDTPSNGEIQSDGLCLYWDGALAAYGEAAALGSHTEGIGIGGQDGTSRFHDGSNPDADALNYSGLIDEFHYFNDRVLTIDEIGLLYSFGNIGPNVEAGPDQIDAEAPAVTLSGSSNDDQKWNSPLTHQWTVARGHGAVEFSLPDSDGIDTRAQLSQAGEYRIRLSAFDGQVTTFDEMTVNIFEYTLFDQFMDSFPSIPVTERGELQNPDGDSWTNLEEYAFGGDPSSFNTRPGLMFDTLAVSENDDEYLEFRYPRRRDATNRELDYRLQISTDLSPDSWQDLGYIEIDPIIVDEHIEIARVRIDLPLSNSNRALFQRIRVSISE